MLINPDAFSKMKAELESKKSESEFRAWVDSGHEVINKYRQVFSPSNISSLNEDDFKKFLLHKNNKHWSGLHRNGNKICNDMDKLKEGLSILLDESQPIENRFDKVIKMVPGMGKAVASAILLVSRPEWYGVWNNTSEAGMRTSGIFPDDRGETKGSKYKKISESLLDLSKELKTDLWTLDSLWWALINIR